MRLSEVVREVIRLGDACRAYWDTELLRRHPHYPIIRPGEGSVPPPPEDAELDTLLKSLPEDQLYALALLAFIGRGDLSADHLPASYHAIKETFLTRDVALAQLTGEKALAEYLTDAIDEMQERHIDLDGLKLEGTAAVS